MSNAAENTNLVAHTKALETIPAESWRCPCRGRWSLPLSSVADCCRCDDSASNSELAS